MASNDLEGSGTPQNPWVLKTPPGTSEFEAYRDLDAAPPALVVQVGATELRYHLRCIEDLHAMLAKRGDWMPLGNADEQKPAKPDTVEAWGRSVDNPVGGWYGLKKGLRGRFGNYVPPVLEALGMAEAEHNPRNNRTRARRWPSVTTSPATSMPPSNAYGRCSPSLELPRLEPPNRMVWGDSMPLGLFEGERTYRLEEVAGGTELSMTELLSGPLSGLITRTIPDMTDSFNQLSYGRKLWMSPWHESAAYLPP